MDHDQRRSSKDDIIFCAEISLQIPKTGVLIILKQLEEVSRSDLQEIISLTFAHTPDGLPRV